MSPKRQPKRSRWKRLVGALAIVTVALAAIAVLGLWWLSHHPVSVGFLTPKIEAAVSNQVSPLSVKLDDLVVTWGGKDELLDLRARNARLLTATGDQLVTIAQLGVDLSAPSLIRGEIVLVAVALIETHVAVVRHPDGKFDFGIADRVPRPHEKSGDDATALLGGWLDASGGEGPLSKLARIEIRDAELEVDDRKLGVTWGSDRFGVSMERTKRGMEGDGDLSLRIGEDRAQLAGTWTFDLPTRDLETRLEVTDLKPALLAGLLPGLGRLEGFDRPVRGWIEAQLTDGLQMRDAQFRLESDWGNAEATIDFADKPKTLSAELELEDVKPWLLAGTMPELETLEAAHLPLDARASLRLADGLLQSLAFELRAGGGALELDQLFGGPLVVGGADLTGRVEDSLAKIEIDDARIELADGPVLTARVSARREGDRYRGSLSAKLDEISVDRLGTFWPDGVAVAVERWITRHIPAGSIHDLKVDLAADLATGEAKRFVVDSLTGSFAYEDLRLDLLPPQPAVTKVDGLATFSTRGFEFEVEGGRFAELELEASRVVITGLDDSAPALTLDVPLTGPAKTVVTVISGEPLTLVPPELLRGLSGHLTATLHMTIPFVGPINMNTMDLAAQADLRQVVWSEAPLDFEVSEGAIALQLNNDFLAVGGGAHVNGVPATIEYREFFKHDDLRRRVHARATLDDEGTKHLGMPEQPYLSGPIGVNFGLAVDRAGITRIEIDADLEQSRLTIPQIGWHKPPYQTGNIAARIEELEDGWNVESVNLAAADLRAVGGLELAADPLSFRRANIERLELAGSLVHGSVARDANGDFLIDVGGRRIDVSSLIELLKQGGQDENPEDGVPVDKPAVHIAVDVDELQLTPQVQVQDLVAKATYDGQRWQEIDLQASSVSDARLTLALGSTQDGRRLRFATDDMGHLAKVVEATNQIDGGSLELSATSPSLNDPWTGRLVAESFTVVGHRWLARILELGTLNSLLNAMKTEGLEFIRVEGKLAGTTQRLQLTEGRALGHGLGITAEGWVDFEKKTLNLSGAAAPARGIRRVLGKIPLVKKILLGPDEIGVIATLYSVSGPFDDIQIKAKPLSIMTPGITREISKLLPDEAAASDE